MYNSFGGYNYAEGMSNRAVEAYEEGAMPMSKWTKSRLVEEIIDRNFPNGISEDLEQRLRKHTTKWLKENFLSYDSWHHTSKHYNRTDFYSVLEDGEEIATELILKEESKTEKKVKESAPAKLVCARWTEFAKNGRRWKAEDIICYGKVKNGWFYGVDNSRKSINGRYFFYMETTELNLKRAYRKARGSLKGFKAWMER